MATRNFDLEEQEQLATLKGWWYDNGNLLLGLVAAVALAVAAWQGWNWYQRHQALQASALYAVLARSVQGGDAKAVRDAGGALTENFSRTLYASLGALATARFQSDRGDTKGAKAQLQWVIERSGSDDLRDIARLRLAALLLDEKAYDEALRLLAEKHADPQTAQYAAARGDVLQAKGQIAGAKAAYRLALDKAEAKNDAFRASVQLRLDGLGG